MLKVAPLLFGFAMMVAGGVGPFADEVACAQESGSVERPGGVPIPFDPAPQESGSVERFDPLQPEPFDPLPAESGSIEKPGGAPIAPESPEDNKTPEGSSPKTSPDGASSAEESATPARVSEFPNLLVPVVVFLIGLFLVAWLLFRIGLFNPYTATLWPKRLELCMEIALRMDDFMTAYREENFTKCQLALDALNHLNGRRSILLSNEINAAVNNFVDHAVSAKVSKDDEAFQKEFSRRYEVVIEALRVGTRQEELSLEVLRSLTKAQSQYRKLKEPASEK